VVARISACMACPPVPGARLLMRSLGVRSSARIARVIERRFGRAVDAPPGVRLRSQRRWRCAGAAVARVSRRRDERAEAMSARRRLRQPRMRTSETPASRASRSAGGRRRCFTSNAVVEPRRNRGSASLSSHRVRAGESARSSSSLYERVPKRCARSAIVVSGDAEHADVTREKVRGE